MPPSRPNTNAPPRTRTRVLLALLAAAWGCALAIGAASPHAARADAPSVAELRPRAELLLRQRAPGVPRGAVESILYMLDVADRIDGGRFVAQSENWRTRAARLLARAEAGTDPFPEHGGQIVSRGYLSPVSERRQGYTIYTPPNYDPTRAYPLMIALHGGSSNGNLFLGVVLGNNMSWLNYPNYLWDEFTPRWSPEWIVVAPDGFGQVLWRWMAERDVLDVIDDVKRHYSVDDDRVVLAGLSNGGLGSYAVGLRNAWRFSMVHAMAGAPSWFQYVGGSPVAAERRAMEPWSGLHITENLVNTDFRIFHGDGDTGPMKPRFVREFQEHVEELGLTPRLNATWFHAGHDILYMVHRHGRMYEQWAEVRRNPRPADVRLVTGDYRAARQHWVEVTRIVDYPNLARIEAHAEGDTITLSTRGVGAFVLRLSDAPLVARDRLRVVVDGASAYDGPRAALGHLVSFVREGTSFRAGFAAGALEKQPGLSGPIMDAYRERMVHVYGTQNPEHVEDLRRAARKGATGWPVWLWGVSQRVIADTEVTPELMAEAHLVIYGTAGDNAVLERMRAQLPIRIEGDALVAGTQRFTERDAGARYVYPNPLAPTRYVIVQIGLTPAAVAAGNNLPDFLPDFVIYDGRNLRQRQRLVAGPSRPLSMGFFDDRWQLPSPAAARATDANMLRRLALTLEDGAPMGEGAGEGAGDEDAGVGSAATATGDAAVVSLLPVPVAPAPPPRPRSFAAPDADPAGRIARAIADLVPTFDNYRALIPGANWRVRDRGTWKIRPEQECLDALAGHGIVARRLPDHPTPVPTPVELLGPIDGVWFRSAHEDRTVIVACELAHRLVPLVRTLKRHGIAGVEVLSSYRDHPRASFHTMGLGLDLSRFHNGRAWLSVLRDFVATPDAETCSAPRPESPAARTLLAIACDLAASNQFSSVLTPNYNEGHRDHFHIDARPDDPRLFLR